VVGGFVPWHGLDHLVLSVEELLNERDELHVLLIGDGPVRAEVEELVRRLGLERRVEFTGFVPAAEVSGYIECMDVCLMPDSNEHGSPIKIFEYMAMGKAVAAPRYGPIEEVIDHGRTGVLFRPRDRADLRDAVRSLVEDAELRSRIGRAARAHVLSRHTWSANVHKVLEKLKQRAR
jgi:glycosyltransferase involved in cell wall biosynthesis